MLIAQQRSNILGNIFLLVKTSNYVAQVGLKDAKKLNFSES